MKKYLIVILSVLLAAVSARAQDIITTKDGRLIRANVTEVTPELVKYRNAANPDGPLYSINRSDVKTILYENGMLDNFDSPKAGTAPVSSYISPEAKANAEAKEKAEADAKAAAAKEPAAEEKIYASPAESQPEVRPATPEELAEAEARAKAEAEAQAKAEAEAEAQARAEAEAQANVEPEDEYIAPWESTEVPFYYDVRYNDIKYDYDTRYYRHQAGDPYSPFLSGLASLWIPGLGQCLDGEWGRGIAFYFGQSSIAFVGLGLLCAPIYDYDILGNGNGNGFFRAAGPILLGTLAAEGLLSLWSICDAAHIAKVKNMYYQDYDRFSTAAINFKVEPSFAFTPAGNGSFAPSAGVALKLSF